MQSAGNDNAAVPDSDRFDFVEAPALGKAVLEVAKALMRQGLSPAEVASLFTHASAVLVQQAGGMPRHEWLALCEALHDGSALEGEHVLTSPGGSA